MEFYLRRTYDNTYILLNDNNSLAVLDSYRRAKFISKLKSKCVGCAANGNGCSAMGSINRRSTLLDTNGKQVTADNCLAEGVLIQV